MANDSSTCLFYTFSILVFDFHHFLASNPEGEGSWAHFPKQQLVIEPTVFLKFELNQTKSIATLISGTPPLALLWDKGARA